MISSEFLFFNNQIALFTNLTIRCSLITTIFMDLNVIKRVCNLAIFACSDSILAIGKMKIINIFIKTIYALLEWHQLFTIFILTFNKAWIMKIFYIRILWYNFKFVIQANSINNKSKFVKIFIFKSLNLIIIFSHINLRIGALKIIIFHLNHTRFT